MIFNSVTFLVFLALVTVLYWTLPRRPRLWLLLIASLTFYGFWRVEFVPVMLLSAATDFLVALRLARTRDPRGRKLLLATSLVVNLGLLAYFKYLLFFADNLGVMASWVGSGWRPPAFDIVLPLGISFYTFQTISYTVDVYRGHREPVRDPVLYGVFVTFFPQLVAGPVLRASEVVPQLVRRPAFDLDDLAVGARRVLVGLFLKVVLADQIAPLVDTGFATRVDYLSALDVWTLAFLFGFQIYFDFSAYSHIAIGCARLMGLRFPENFDFPYLAHSPKDFWRRWHISLSSWIRDYLYLPLTGARVGTDSTGGLGMVSTRRTRALFLTWAVMGLWHGANWTFVVWGLYHALWIYAHRQLRPVLAPIDARRRRKLGHAISLPIAMLGWIPFRAGSVADTLAMFTRVLEPRAYLRLGLHENTYLITALLLLGCYAAFFVWYRVVPRLRVRPRAWALAVPLAMGVVTALDFIHLRPIAQFIYFQF